MRFAPTRLYQRGAGLVPNLQVPTGNWASPEPQASTRSWASPAPQLEAGHILGLFCGFICSCLFWVFPVLENIIKMTANATVVNTNEFFCVPVGKSRQAAIFLGNLVKNAIEEGKRIPKRMEMGSDLGTCIKWIEDIGVPVIVRFSDNFLLTNVCLVGGNSAANGRRLWRR